MEPNTITPVGITKITGPAELLKNTWSFFAKHWKLLVAITIIPAVISLVAQLLFSIINPIVAILAILLIIVSVILSIVMQGAVIGSIDRYSKDPTASLTIKGQYAFGFRYFWSIIFIIILQIFIFAGSYALFVIPGIIISIYTSMYAMTLFVDNKRGFSAFTESFSVVKGRWWAVLGRFVILALVIIVVYAVVFGLLYLLGFLSGISAQSLTANIVYTVINLAIGAITGPFIAIYMYKMYESLKATRAQVSTSSFKNWLVAFLSVGILATVVILLTLPLVVLSSLNAARMKAEQARVESQARMADIENMIENSNIDTTLYTQ